MKKLGFVLAGAVLFDLGSVVANAAETLSLNFSKIKLDEAHTASSCLTGGGSVIKSGKDAYCQIPVSTGGPANSKVVLTDVLVSSKTANASTAPSGGTPGIVAGGTGVTTKAGSH